MLKSAVENGVLRVAHRLLQCGRTALTAMGTESAPLAASVRFAFWHFLPLLLNDCGVRLVEYACGTPSVCVWLGVTSVPPDYTLGAPSEV